MPETNVAAVDVEELFRAHRGRLWGIAYRLTGTVADADDVVQETFTRLVERPPAVGDATIAGWLVRVATNLGIDALRMRRRRPYTGAWLPEPIERGDDLRLGMVSVGEPSLEARYDLFESVTFAFLAALEGLAPRQRAILLLRDVLGYSAAETAALLETTEGNVRVLHLRARRAMEAYDRERCIPTAETLARHGEALQRLLECFFAQNARGLEALLVEQVRTATDANGEYTALATPLSGRARVARFYLQAAAMRLAGGPRVDMRTVNGLPAALVTLAQPVRRQAPRSLILLDLAADGRIRSIYSVLAPRKLSGIS